MSNDVKIYVFEMLYGILLDDDGNKEAAVITEFWTANEIAENHWMSVASRASDEH